MGELLLAGLGFHGVAKVLLAGHDASPVIL